MDLVQVLRSKAPAGQQIDPEYVARISAIPQTMLVHERGTLEASMKEVSSTSEQLSAKHLNDFVDAKSSMDQVGDLLRTMSQASTGAIELSLALPRPSERAYTVLRRALDDELTVYLESHRVQELLAIPELVRDCVIGGNYEAALNLASMTDLLRIRYPGIQLVEQLIEEVNLSVQSMKGILLRSLREGSELKLLTKAVAYLRRVSPENLPAVFVDSRWAFLQSQWSHIPVQLKSTQPYSYLNRFVNIYREHVFATISGFYTNFSQKQDLNGSLEEAVLSRFARSALKELLATLREHAPRIKDPSERATLWLQLASCSQSLGRAGAEFWPMLDASILTHDEWSEAHQQQQTRALVTGRQADKARS